MDAQPSVQSSRVAEAGRDSYPLINDYALIGDCRTAALVSRYGSIEWLCLPQFDSPSIFAAILDRHRGGKFSISPQQVSQIQRRYVGDTNVLETTFTTATGVCRVTDMMSVATEEEKLRIVVPQHEILRKLECLEGEVNVEVMYQPRPRYGKARPQLVNRAAWGCFYQYRQQVLVLGSDVPLDLNDDNSEAHGSITIHAGDRRYFALTYAEGEPAVLPPLGTHAQERIDRTLRWWEEWASHCTYRGPYRAHVIRSILTLKLLAYAPSGAIVAAPTTSLPEALGGVRNWDYRFCWLRDAAFTVRVLNDLGYRTEAQAFLSWILHATRKTQPRLQILYTIFGESFIPERELKHLAGYRQSSPVRIGNDAGDQLQLDIYGEVVLAVYEYISRGGQLDRSERRLLKGIGMLVSKIWKQPDEGIWEVRSGRHHHTYSKAMCWIALDRLIKMHELGHLQVPVEDFRATRDQIREEIERRGYNTSLQSYVDRFDGDNVDASLLLLGIDGYADPRSERMTGTLNQIQRVLCVDGLLYRYLAEKDGLPPGEGAFGICSFWRVQCLALSGQVSEAKKQFENVLNYANDLGLFAEEIDPHSGEALGNFPQAFTHIGLIDTALLFEELERKKQEIGRR